MPAALPNSVHRPVASELDRYLRSSQGAVYRMPLSDQERARRAAGVFLLLTRRVLKIFALSLGPVERARIAALFVYQSRSLLEQLRLLEINCDPGFGLIARRVRERLSQIRSLIAGMQDTSAALRLVEVELLVLSGDLTAAHAVLEPLMLSISTIQSRDLRDEVAIRVLRSFVDPNGEPHRVPHPYGLPRAPQTTWQRQRALRAGTEADRSTCQSTAR